MTVYTIRLGDRTLSIRVDATWLSLPTEKLSHPYKNVQEAADTALTVLAAACNIATPERLALRLAEIQVSIEGHRREVDAFLMHWHILHGASRDDLSRVMRTEIDRGPSIYETFDFGSHWPRLAEIRELAERWSLIAPQVGMGQDGDVLSEHDRGAVRDERPRVGIIGVTGCGKSMLINALLRRNVLSSSSGNSTACVTEIRHADDRPEGVRVRLRPRDAIEKEIANRRGEIERLHAPGPRGSLARTIEKGQQFTSGADGGSTAVERLRQLNREVDDLEKARDIDEKTLLPLQDLARVTNIEVSAAVLGIEKATVFLDAPILRLVTLVDTPGTQDPDEDRRRVAIREMSSLHAWIYLISAEQAPTDTIVKEWIEFRRPPNEGKGHAIVLTKADQLARDDKEPIGAVLSRRDRDYRRLLGEPAQPAQPAAQRAGSWTYISPCAAQPVVLAAQAGRWGRVALDILISLHGLDTGQEQAIEDRLRLLARDPSVAETVVDYVSDLCQIVQVGRVMAFVSQAALVSAAANVRELLARRFEEACRLVEQRISGDEAQRQRWFNLAELEEMLPEMRVRAADGQALHSKRQEMLEDVRSAATKKARSTREQFQATADTLRPDRRSHDARVKAKGMDHLLSGPCRYDVLDYYERPLATQVVAEMREFVDVLRDELAKMLEAGSAKDGLVNLAAKLMKGWTLLPEGHVVSEEEGFWEWSESALARLYEKTLRECDRSRGRMVADAVERLEGFVTTLVDFARRELLNGPRAEIGSLEEEVERLERHIQELRDGTDVDPSLLDERIAAMRGVLGEVAALRDAAAGEYGTPSAAADSQPRT